MASKPDRAIARHEKGVESPRPVTAISDSKLDIPEAGKQSVPPSKPQGVPREIPIAQIHITKNNIRTEFNTPDDEEMVQSVRENGVLERLLVRDNSKWKGKGDQRPDYDLMAGERRLRAAIKAGLTIVPCEVFDVDDEKAYEIMLVENLQSKDLHELDYAKGLRIMMKRFGYNVEQTAARIQKGETFVREMLCFGGLPAAAEQAFRNGAISKSHAVLIATIPDEKKREEFAKRVLTGKGYRDFRGSGEPLSVLRAKELKGQEYMKDLGKAPFPLDKQTDPAWPYSCLTCPHYNGNTPEARQGKRPNICLNPTHYAVMVDLHAEARLKAVRDRGANVMSVAETSKAFEANHQGVYQLRYCGSDYVDLEKTFYDYAKSAPQSVQWSRVAKGGGIEPIIAITPDGKEHRVAPKDKIEAAAKKLGHRFSYTSSSSRSKPKASASEQTKKVSANHRRAAINALLQKLLTFDWRKATRAAWQQFALLVVEESLIYGDGGDDLLIPILGMPPVKKKSQEFQAKRKFITSYAAKLKTVLEVQGFIGMCLVATKLAANADDYGCPFDKDDLAIGTAFGVNLKELEKKAAQADAPKAKAKRASKITPPAKPKARAARV